MANQVLRVGVAGLGTVGSGVLKILRDGQSSLGVRCGAELVVTAVSARDRNKDRGVDLGNFVWHDDPLDLARDPEVDVVIELIGGSEGIAKELAEVAIANGKPVLTANKALIAHHGLALAAAAEKAGVALYFEAAVAGGIPIIKSLREGLAANVREHIYGILNGTCNYILTVMEESGRDFAEVLAEAQKLGIAEADPSFDVDGIDTAHKLAILASVAFGTEIDFDAVHIEGIRNISAEDIEYTKELGYRIKLLGIARLGDDGLEQRVHPCLVPLGTPIAHVSGVDNAVVVHGDSAGRTVTEGAGAGAGPTASAVVADLMDVARGWIAPPFGVAGRDLVKVAAVPLEKHGGAIYMRLVVRDEPGVIAEITSILKAHEVSVASFIQRGQAPGEAVNLVFVTHDTDEASAQKCIAEIQGLEAVMEAPIMVRIKHM